MYRLLALFSGFLISVMVAINGALDGYFGTDISVFIIHIVGFFSVNFILLFKKENIKSTKPIPFYLFIGGAIGIFTTYFNILCFKYIGIAITTSLALLGQSTFSCLIDHFGLFGVNKHEFNKHKVFGFLLILCGIAIMTFY